MLPCACSDLPGSWREPRLLQGSTLPYLVLLRMGFTLPPMLVGAVRSYRTISPLPRRPRPVRRYIFCGTFRGLTPPRRYLASCSVEPGLSSNRGCHHLPSATAQPARRGSLTTGRRQRNSGCRLFLEREGEIVETIARKTGGRSHGIHGIPPGKMAEQNGEQASRQGLVSR